VDIVTEQPSQSRRILWGAGTAGKTVTWSAIAIFRIRDGKIAEEWVNRDELGMSIELGVFIPSRMSA
jgi:predicted ester cyclase